jgi:hypothetical protein
VRRIEFAVLLLALVLAAAEPARAVLLQAGPNDYRDAVRRLRPGDTLQLQPGIYRNGLSIHRLLGTAAAPIAIRGAVRAGRSVFVPASGRNTVSIVDSAYVTVAELDLFGEHAAVDAVKAEGTSRFAHHITIEGLRIVGYNFNQQIVGISTKCPAWDWTIRRNDIRGAGTGMYLGNSDGSAPFVRGVIEANVVVGTRGYSLQVKHQQRWPDQVAVDGIRGDTIIRYNTFAKSVGASTGDDARPNVLLGHQPRDGRGSDDRFVVYGNLFVDNPDEALLQAEGNLTLYNNVFVNRRGDALTLREHHDAPRAVDVFRNTIIAQGTGVLLRNPDRRFAQTISSNAIFAARVVPEAIAHDNFVRPASEVAHYLRSVGNRASPTDLAPQPDALLDPHWRPDGRLGLPDVVVDFDRRPRPRMTYGAYAGDASANALR